MPTIVNKDFPKNKPPKHTLDRKFDTAEEAAQAKTDYVWSTVLKNVDWDKLEEMRKSQRAEP